MKRKFKVGEMVYAEAFNTSYQPIKVFVSEFEILKVGTLYLEVFNKNCSTQKVKLFANTLKEFKANRSGNSKQFYETKKEVEEILLVSKKRSEIENTIKQMFNYGSLSVGICDEKLNLLHDFLNTNFNNFNR